MSICENEERELKLSFLDAMRESQNSFVTNSILQKTLENLDKLEVSLENYQNSVAKRTLKPLNEKMLTRHSMEAPFHEHKPSMIVKNVNQSYQGILRHYKEFTTTQDNLSEFLSLDNEKQPTKNNLPSPLKKCPSHKSPRKRLNSRLISDLRSSTPFSSFSSVTSNNLGNYSKITEPISPYYAFELRHSHNQQPDSHTASTVEIEPDITEHKSPNFTFEKNIKSKIQKNCLGQSNRMFCNICSYETPVQISFKLQSLSVWKTIQYFFNSVRSCGDVKTLNRYHEVLHTCKKCGNVVARVQGL